MPNGGRRLVAGVDCSTQATKVVIVDAESGELVSSGIAPHVVDVDGVRSETDPEVWYEALHDALAATGLAHEVAAMSIAAQQLSLVVLDADGRPLRPAILWDDTRAAGETQELQDALGGAGAWLDRIGFLLRPGLTLTSWAWLRRHEPHVAAQAAGIRLPHDFLTERLTGRAVTDRGDASATGWWSARSESYVDDVLSLEMVGLGTELLPAVLAADAVAGEVVVGAGQYLGLRPGTVVGCGTGDNMAAALALAVEPGEPVMSLGTSGTVYLRATTPSQDPTGSVTWQASASGDLLPLGCTLNAALAVDRVAALFGFERDAVPVSTDAVVMPYFGGERLPNYPSASGTITGLRADTTGGDVLLATYEGVVVSLLDGMEVLAAQSSGIGELSPITLVGGGARGRVWQETVRRLSGRAIAIPERAELVAWGAAAQAAAGLTGESSVEIARRWKVAAGRVLEPMPVDNETLSRIRAVREAADDLNRFRSPAPTV